MGSALDRSYFARAIGVKQENRNGDRYLKKFAVSVFTVLLVFVFALTDAKASLVYNWDSVFNGATPTSTAPWLTATFTTVEDGWVELKLEADLNVRSEFFDKLAFNVNPDIDPSTLTFDPTTYVKASDQNAQKLSGGGSAGHGFDILLDFPSKKADRFGDSDVLIYNIYGTGLKEGDCGYNNSSGLYIAAQVQGIPPEFAGGPTSGAITTGAITAPIPAAVWLLGSGLLGLIAIRRVRKVWK